MVKPWRRAHAIVRSMSAAHPVSPITAADYHQRILGVLVHIQNHLDDTVSLDDLAAIACFSTYHFHRIFTGMVGEGVEDFGELERFEVTGPHAKSGAESARRS